MCGRYAFFAPVEAIRRLFGVEIDETPEPRYNIAPTQRIAIVRGGATGPRELAMVRWGLVPRWARDATIGQRMINARAETVAEKPAFRDAFRRRRCLVLANGWYEWQATPQGKQPWFIQSADHEPLGLAGLWESWPDPASAEVLETCTIITTAAAPPFAALHDRMPWVMPRAAYADWLDPGQRLPAWPGPDSEGLLAQPVSRAVNDARHEGAQLVEPLSTD